MGARGSAAPPGDERAALPGPLDLELDGSPLFGPRLESETFTLAFAPDGERLVTGHKDGHFRFWDVRAPEAEETAGVATRPSEVAVRAGTGTLRFPPGRSMRQVPFSETGELFAVASSEGESGDGVVRVFKTRSLREQLLVRTSAVPVAFCDHDLRLVTVDSEGLRHWDLRSRRTALRRGFPSLASERGYRPELAVVDPARQAALVPADADTVVLIRLEDGALLRRWTSSEPFGPVFAVAPNLRQIAASAGFGRLALHGVDESGAPTTPRYGEHQSTLHGITFTPDGRGLIAASHGDLVHREVAPWSSTALIGDLSHTFYAVAASPDGKTVAAVSKQVVELWNLATRRLAVSLPWVGQERDGPSILGFDPTGRFLVVTEMPRTGANEGSLNLRVWIAPSFEELERSRAVEALDQTSR